MPIVAAPGTVLVTGASGFIATHVVKILLDEGYTVVGTVRSTAKGDYLKTLFDNFGDKFSYLIVEDVEAPGAFDEAVKGVEAVEHTASPFHMVADDPAELVGPAVKGTVGILESILRNGTQVKRVVITSSFASVIEPKDTKPYTFTEADWNNYSPGVVEKEGRNAPPGHKYRTSKVLAERAAWDFVEKNKPSWDLVTINPPLVFGPTMHEIKDVSALNESIAQFRKAVITPPSKEACAAAYGNQVDVRDVALAHVLAIQKEAASGERFLISNGPWVIQDLYDTLREARVANIPEGYPGCQKDTVSDVADGSKATRLLGLKYHTFQQTAVDTLQSIRTRFPDAK